MIAEWLGALLLAAAVIGSGIMAERLADGNLAVALIANTFATVAALAALIAMLGPISGAHFNPVISLVEAVRGKLPGWHAAELPRRASPWMLHGRDVGEWNVQPTAG